MKVSVGSRWWLPAALLAAVPLLMASLLLVPESEREGSNSEVLFLVAGTATLVGLIFVVAYFARGSDSFTADEGGLRTRSRKHGNQDLAWSELAELGWVVPGRYARGGLAGRKRDGGAYAPGGPNIAGWLAQPTGQVRPTKALESLQRLCAEHGVEWKDYAAAEVM